MADRRRPEASKGPVNVAVTAGQRRALRIEAQRRGLAISSTIRTLALERLAEVAEERELQRAEKWQLEQVLAVVDEIASGAKRRSVPRSEIDAIFDAAIAEARSRAGRVPRAG
jgi:hypothetical protein